MAKVFAELDAIVTASPGADVDADFFTELKTNQESNTVPKFSTLAVYTANDTAIIGGLGDGDLYRTTTGALMVVYTP